MKLYRLETTSLVSDNIEILPYDKTNDMNFMLEKISGNYMYYNQASDFLKKHIAVVNTAISSCIQHEMHDTGSINIAHAKVILFIEKVRSASGLIIQSWTKKTNDDETIVYSVDKPKVKNMNSFWGSKAA